MVSLWRTLFVAAVAVTCVLCLAPLRGSSAVPSADKIAHYLMFLTNGVLAIPAFSPPARKRAWWFLLILGFILEVLQGLVPMRQPSLADGIANAGGTLTAWLAAWIAQRGSSGAGVT